MNLSSRVFASFAYAQDVNGQRKFKAIVVRGRDGWVHQQTKGQSLADPLPGRLAENLAGGTIDTLSLRVDMERDVAWIHDRSVPLDGGNVLLVDRIDGVGGPLAILGAERVPFPDAADADCAGTTMQFELDSLRSLLLNNPQVQAFAGVDEGWAR